MECAMANAVMELVSIFLLCSVAGYIGGSIIATIEEWAKDRMK